VDLKNLNYKEIGESRVGESEGGHRRNGDLVIKGDRVSDRSNQISDHCTVRMTTIKNNNMFISKPLTEFLSTVSLHCKWRTREPWLSGF
jgi:hypothetical protein